MRRGLVPGVICLLFGAGHAQAQSPPALEAPRPKPGASEAPWIAGGQLGLATGLASHVGSRFAGFAERSTFGTPSVRLVGWLGLNAIELGATTVHHSVLAARAELCSPALGRSWLEWRACGAGDGGVVLASSSRPNAPRDSVPWVALAAHTRLRVWVSSRVGLETEVGGLFPLTRYSVLGAERVTYLRDTAGFTLALGAAARFE